MKLQLLKKNIVLICLLLLSSLIAHATDKIVSITGDATHSGTYVYQGTHTSTSGCGTSRTYKYYKLSGTNYYLYADYDNMGCTDDWFGWYICNGLIARPGQAPGHEFIYNGYMSDYSLVPDNPGGCNAWINLAGGNVTSNFSITDAASGVAPTVSTLEASLVTTTSGTIGGNVLADGGATVTAKGLVFSPSSNTTPVIGGTNVTQYAEGTGTGSYTQLVSSLTAGATYYYQAYGTNSYGTTYGGVKSFTTPTTSQPNKLVSGITSPSAANGVYVWIGNYYGKPAWKHQTLNYWVYYSRLGTYNLTSYNWYIDGQLRDEHGSGDYYFYHSDASTCPASGWASGSGNGTGTGVPAITDYPNVSFTNGASFSPGNPMANTTNKPIGRFYLSGELAGASLTAITINASGTRSGVSNLKLWSSSSATFSTGSATQLNSQSDGSTVTFSGISSSISTSGTYYFITTDLAATASGSFTLTIGSQANLTISGGAIASSFSNATLTSGAITIIGFPTISTTAASSIATASATLGGNVTANGGATVSDRGIVYSSTNTNPTIGGTGVIQDTNGSGTGTFSKSIGPLAQGTTYYFNAYATNTAGTSYGTATSFTTLKTPTVTTQAVSSISTTTATGNGNITNLGIPNPTAFGVCWNMGGTPTISDSKTDNGAASVTGAFTALMTGLSSSTTYHVRAFATNTAGTGYGDEVTFITSTLTTTWNGSAWNPSTPISVDNVVLDGNYNAAGFTCNNITVNAGKQVTITSGTLSVTGNFTLKSDAVNGTATLIDNGTVTVGGTTSVEQYLSAARNWYISSPVSNAVAPAGYTYYKYDEPGDNSSYTPPASAYWESVSSGTAFSLMRGYIALPTAASTITFVAGTGGSLNTGNKTIVLTRTTGKTKEGFNLVGNPYPSHLTWNKATADAANALSTIWYRTVVSSAYTFQTFNADGGIGSPSGVTGLIPPMQAFWVRVNTGGGTLTFTNSMRSHSTTNPLKAPAANKTAQPVLRLQVSNGINTDETVLYFNANASNGYDAYDSPKMSNELKSIPEIYTTVGTEQLVINGMNSIPLDTEIALGFKTGETNTFSIKANEISNLASNLHVILKDKALNTEFDLTDGSSYSFTSEATTTTGRFSIIFHSAGAVTGIPTATNNVNLLVYRNANNQIVVQIKGQLNDSYSLDIYNSIGQKLVSKQTTTGITIIDAPQSGVYFVTVKGNGDNTTKKVIIN